MLLASELRLWPKAEASADLSACRSVREAAERMVAPRSGPELPERRRRGGHASVPS